MVGSSYIFNRKPGDKVTISGPYGEFFINHSDSEMLYIGGGVGMAHLVLIYTNYLKQLKLEEKFHIGTEVDLKVSYSILNIFRSLEREFKNFKFYLVLSEAKEEDNWTEKKDIDDPNGDGFVGFVHNAAIDQYLSKHEAPEDIELYFCGPPMMNQSVLKMKKKR